MMYCNTIFISLCIASDIINPLDALLAIPWLPRSSKYLEITITTDMFEWSSMHFESLLKFIITAIRARAHSAAFLLYVQNGSYKFHRRGLCHRNMLHTVRLTAPTTCESPNCFVIVGIQPWWSGGWEDLVR